MNFCCPEPVHHRPLRDRIDPGGEGGLRFIESLQLLINLYKYVGNKILCVVGVLDFPAYVAPDFFLVFLINLLYKPSQPMFSQNLMTSSIAASVACGPSSSKDCCHGFSGSG